MFSKWLERSEESHQVISISVNNFCIVHENNSGLQCFLQEQVADSPSTSCVTILLIAIKTVDFLTQRKWKWPNWTNSCKTKQKRHVPLSHWQSTGIIFDLTSLGPLLLEGLFNKQSLSHPCPLQFYLPQFSVRRQPGVPGEHDSQNANSRLFLLPWTFHILLFCNRCFVWTRLILFLSTSVLGCLCRQRTLSFSMCSWLSLL